MKRRSIRRGATSPGEPRRIAYLYILPAFAFYGVLVLAPMVGTMGLSLFAWDGLNQPRFVGIANFLRLVTDPRLSASVLHAAVMVVFLSLLPILIGLVAAIALSRTTTRLMSTLRAILFLPYVLPAVVVAMVWRWMYEPTTGLVNSALRAIGLDGLARPWLGDFDLALPAVGLAGTWFLYPFTMILFLAGIQRISRELYDAARVDGAGVIQESRFVTIPGLREELLVALVVTLISSFRNFDLVYNMTRGGPGSSTIVPALEVFKRAFLQADVGSAAALGTAVFVILVTVVSGILFASRGAR